jgi:tRNA pseudouridine38-40 synthase
MRHIKLVLAYDGTSYFGWERQKGFPSVQQAVEQAVESLTGQRVPVVASGRTDAGVHALGQVAHLHCETRHDPATIVRALNAILPRDIRVCSAADVPESFHATYDARGKLYRYVLHDGPVLDPMLRLYVWHCPWRLDDAAMHRAARCLMGTHDFSSFETSGAPRQTSVRTISHLTAQRAGPGHLWSRQPLHGVDAAADLVYIEIAADGFLYNMVRAISGTLLNVGRRFWPEECVPEILAARDRRRAGPTAPAHGLFLVSVQYDSAAA